MLVIAPVIAQLMGSTAMAAPKAKGPAPLPQPIERKYQFTPEAVKDVTASNARGACTLLGQPLAKGAAFVSIGADGVAGIDLMCGLKDKLDALPIHPEGKQNTDRFDALIEVIRLMTIQKEGFGRSDVLDYVGLARKVGVQLADAEIKLLERLVRFSETTYQMDLELPAGAFDSLLASRAR